LGSFFLNAGAHVRADKDGTMRSLGKATAAIGKSSVPPLLGRADEVIE
jgi:hypothetical protein